jgi:hypothetical protein
LCRSTIAKKGFPREAFFMPVLFQLGADSACHQMISHNFDMESQTNKALADPDFETLLHYLHAQYIVSMLSLQACAITLFANAARWEWGKIRPSNAHSHAPNSGTCKHCE